MSRLTAEILRHELPKDEALEMEVLGFCLATKDPMVKLFDAEISPEDFAYPLHERIFGMLREQLKRHPRADSVALAKVLSGDQDLQDRGGPSYFKRLRESYQGERQAVSAAKHVKDLARRRALVMGLTQTLFQALDLKCSLPEALASTHVAVADTMSATETRKLVPQAEVMHEMMTKVHETIARNGRPLGLSTGSPSLDRAMAGLCPGGYYILAGRPGSGKTAKAINVATHVAQSGVPVLFFSLEMPRVELLERQTAAMLSIDALKFRGVGRFTDDEQRLMWDQAERIASLPIIHYDLSRIQAHEIRTLTHIARQRHNVGLVVVDYIGLVKPDKRTGKRNEDVGMISATLRETAKDLMIPVLALAQMNRGVENRSTEPQLSDLRESGDLEQDAAAVMFLYEDKDDEAPDDTLKRITLKLAKNRHGPQCKIPFWFEKSFLRFKEVARDDAYQQYLGASAGNWQDQQ